MGEVLVDPIICGPKGCKTLEGIAVDTGSTDTVITKELAQELGIRLTGRTPYGTADRPILLGTGVAEIKLNGRRREISVAIHNFTVIGRTTIEQLGFKIDPVAGKLEPRPLEI